MWSGHDHDHKTVEITAQHLNEEGVLKVIKYQLNKRVDNDRDEKNSKFRRFMANHVLRPPNALPGTKTHKLIHPRSSFYVVWSLANAVLLLWIAISVPLRLAFDPEDSCKIDVGWIIWDFIVDSIFILDIVLHFFVCRTIDGYLIDEREVVYRDYAKTEFVLDVIKCFPVSWFQLPLYLTNSGCQDNLIILQLLKILKGLRVMRLVRLANMKRLVGNMTIHSTFLRNPNMINLLKLMLFLLFAVHCVACLWWFVKRDDPKLYMFLLEHDLTDSHDASRYLICFYFAIATLTTVGYGDVHGTNDAERLTAVLCMFVGGLLFAAIISQVSSLFMSALASSNKHEAKKEEIITFMQARKVPLSLQKQITRFFDRFGSDSLTTMPKELLADLPASLNYQLWQVMSANTLTKVTIFRNLQADFVMEIYRKLLPLRCAPGELLVRPGKKAETIFFVMQGGLLVVEDDKSRGGKDSTSPSSPTSVKVVAGSITDELEEGDVFGASAVFESKCYTAAVLTREFTELFFLKKSALVEVCSKFPGKLTILRRRARLLKGIREKMAAAGNAGRRGSTITAGGAHLQSVVRRVISDAKTKGSPNAVHAEPHDTPPAPRSRRGKPSVAPLRMESEEAWLRNVVSSTKEALDTPEKWEKADEAEGSQYSKTFLAHAALDPVEDVEARRTHNGGLFARAPSLRDLLGEGQAPRSHTLDSSDSEVEFPEDIAEMVLTEVRQVYEAALMLRCCSKAGGRLEADPTACAAALEDLRAKFRRLDRAMSRIGSHEASTPSSPTGATGSGLSYQSPLSPIYGETPPITAPGTPMQVPGAVPTSPAPTADASAGPKTPTSKLLVPEGSAANGAGPRSPSPVAAAPVSPSAGGRRVAAGPSPGVTVVVSSPGTARGGDWRGDVGVSSPLSIVSLSAEARSPGPNAAVMPALGTWSEGDVGDKRRPRSAALRPLPRPGRGSGSDPSSPNSAPLLLSRPDAGPLPPSPPAAVAHSAPPATPPGRAAAGQAGQDGQDGQTSVPRRYSPGAGVAAVAPPSGTADPPPP